MRTLLRLGVLVSFTLVLGVPASLAQQQSPVVDAQGDAVAGPPFHDLDVITVTVQPPFLFVSVSFHTAIAPPSAGSFISVLAVIEFDTDQNSATGEPPVQNGLPPLTVLPLGVEYIANVVSEFDHPGLIDIQDATTGDILGTVPIQFTTFAFEFNVPLEFLGNDDGLVDFTAACGSFQEPTDGMDVVGVSNPGGDPFFRGDCTGNGIIDLADPLYLLFALSGSGDPIDCQHACDSNDDGALDVADAVYELSFLFTGGPPPAGPYPDCGFDPTPDDLSCESYFFCLE